jgi:hypothetical protein
MSTVTERNDRTNVRAEEIRRREDAIRDIVMRAGERLSREDIKHVTGKLCVSRATAYRMIRTFRSCGAVTDPETRPVGRPKGARVLDPMREYLIRETVLNFYFRPSRPKFSELVQEIKTRCEKQGLRAPNWRTVKTRVQDIEAQLQARRAEGS